MNWTELFSALALVLIIEGIIPFINPLSYKKTLQKMLAMPESTLRVVGLGLMLVGALSLFFIRG
jgi:uncharacterized protein YjeT (DUF2065 family)